VPWYIYYIKSLHRGLLRIQSLLARAAGLAQILKSQ
jgi:hypothetical protein